MGLFRLLFWLAIIFTAIWLWRRLTRRAAPKQSVSTPTPMVRCTQCGVHVPREQALQYDEHWYCSQAHLEQDSPPGER